MISNAENRNGLRVRLPDMNNGKAALALILYLNPASPENQAVIPAF
jgi:hypothetical protein